MKQREILLLSISVFAIIAIWIVSSVWHNLNVSKIPETTAEKIKPISAKFDRETIENIKRKEHIEPIYGTEVSSKSADGTPLSIEEIETIIEGSSPSALEINQ